jgi:type II secretory pathway pseudopilin PulG
MAALIVALAVMLLGMSVAAPTWRYVVKNMKEEELIFRGNQIADAIKRYQAKNANAVPTSLDILVEGKYLRKAYTDPMTEDGEWRLIRPGEPLGTQAPSGDAETAGRSAPRRTAPGRERSSTARRSGPTARATLGGIVGVASKSDETGLRLYNGRSKYSEWIFAPGQPRLVGGRPIGPALPQLPGSQGGPAAGAPGGVPPLPGGRRPAQPTRTPPQ